MRNIGKNLLVGGALVAASLALAPGRAGAVTGFRWVAINPTRTGATLTVNFDGAGQHDTINLQLQTNAGVFHLPGVAPMAPGPVEIAIDYQALGVPAGTTVDNIYGQWAACRHKWGISGRPSGGAFTLPAVLPPPPPPIAPMSAFLARKAQLNGKPVSRPALAVSAPIVAAKKAEPIAAAPVVRTVPAVAIPSQKLEAAQTSVAYAQLAAMLRMRKTAAFQPVTGVAPVRKSIKSK